jgi:hypothetical protein
MATGSNRNRPNRPQVAAGTSRPSVPTNSETKESTGTETPSFPNVENKENPVTQPVQEPIETKDDQSGPGTNPDQTAAESFSAASSTPDVDPDVTDVDGNLTDVDLDVADVQPVELVDGMLGAHMGEALNDRSAPKPAFWYNELRGGLRQRVLAPDAPISFVGEDIDGEIYVMEDVVRQYFPPSSRRPTYTLVLARGSKVQRSAAQGMGLELVSTGN